MTDEQLAAIKARLSAALPGPWTGMNIRDTIPLFLHASADMDALVAEVERLREEAHDLRLMVEEAALAENLNAEDAKRERAAVVAWLRERGLSLVEVSAAQAWASKIERGKHRREEEP